MKFATDFYKNANSKEIPCTITVAEVSPSGISPRKRHNWKSTQDEVQPSKNEAQDEKDERALSP